MHLLFENVAKHMFKHWSGDFYKRIDTSNEPSVLSKKMWKEIGKSMHLNRKQMPLEFGRPLRNIQKHYREFKATEWSNWITMYSLPFLNQKLPRLCNKFLTFYHIYCEFIKFIKFIISYLEGWLKFVTAVQICLKWKITDNDLGNVQNLLVEFFTHYEL